MSRKEKWEDKEKVIARKEEEEKSFPFLFPLFLRSTHFPPFFYGLSWKWKGEEGLTTGKRREVLRGRGLFCLLSPSSCTMKAVAPSSFLFFPTVQIAPFDVEEEEETETDIASLHSYRNCGTNTSFRFSGKGEWYVRRMYQVLSLSLEVSTVSLFFF